MIHAACYTIVVLIVRVFDSRQEGSKVLVHCKMGVSRSASVVIAYAMKAYNWSFKKALEHVQSKRTCIKPNKHFQLQLETYQGILAAMKNREKLQRSKSETNLVVTSGLITPPNSPKKPLQDTLRSQSEGDKDATPPRQLDKEDNEPVVVTDCCTPQPRLLMPPKLNISGYDLMKCASSGRPKSWSPENSFATDILNSSGEFYFYYDCELNYKCNRYSFLRCFQALLGIARGK